MPTPPDLTELIWQEAAKRDRNWNPAQRWRVIQETITWAESQFTVRRNTKEACLANQTRLLIGLAEYETNKNAGQTPSATSNSDFQ